MTEDTDPTPPPLYAAVVALARRPTDEPRTLDEIGVAAWQTITPGQRQADLPHVLGTYVMRVFDEECARAAQQDAADPGIHGYLEPTDEVSAWDAYHCADGRDDAEVDRDVLLRILCELELLRHRLDMAGRGDADTAE